MSPTDLDALERATPGAVATRASDRLRMAHDASHYLLTPRAVVTPTDAGQVAALFRAGTPLTFRSGGTSLSGQAVSGHVLVDTRRHFRAIEVLDAGARVRAQPGAVLRQVNARLAPHGRRLGPDPASESACTIGGVVADNSSGMTCGTEANTYRTLESLVAVLPSGTVVDTGAADADERLRADEPALHAGLLALRARVLRDPGSVRRIAAQYAMKNTMGYGLNALVDHDTAVQILAHLLVGSEGTLAFVAEATFRTVPVLPHAATALRVFPTLGDAAAAVPALVATGAAAVELLDAASLRVAQRDPQAPAALRGLVVDQQAALLVEWQAADSSTLPADDDVTTDARERAALWHIRKGLYASVAGARPSGTTALLEDVAVPLPALADTCAQLTALVERHGYAQTVVFGHAKDGNLHFMLTERFPAGVDRYAAFTEDLVDLVLGAGGTLKAEHGTGRVMAPFVRRQFGDELYAVMREIKALCDPRGILNPGVLLSDDGGAHLRDLKVTPSVEAEVDRCVECGYCEPVCPSKDLTTTPRQRIVLRRELATARAAGDTQLVHELTADQDYDVVETCAVDGMCATACPVLINTGDLVKRLRAEAAGVGTRSAWRVAAGHWDATTRTLATALDIAAALPPAVPEAATRAARGLGAPQWSRDLPRGGARRRPHADPEADAVYLPSCLHTMFGPSDGVQTALQRLAGRAGAHLVVPDGIAGLCCGTPWSSKGLADGHAAMRDRVRAALGDDDRPVVTDAASCTEGFVRLLDGRPVLDAVTYVERLLPRLVVTRRLGSLALHPTCSSVRLGLDASVHAVASAIADEVVVPDGWQCCGFAGDRGLLHPELTASATRAEAASVAQRTFDAYASVNRTCEIGLSRATGRPYRHLLELVEEATRRR